MRDAILKRIRDAAYHAGRDESDIRLIAVSKQQGQDRVRQCLVDGQRDFGENRVREALVRWGGSKGGLSGFMFAFDWGFADE